MTRSAPILALTAIGFSGLMLSACSDNPTPQARSYVGAASCVQCHAEAGAAWVGSHHDLAMQTPSEGTVLGDFDEATLTYFGRVSTFFRREGGYFVNTPGPDGEAADFQITYVLGVDPLQQYVIELPDGKFQMLGIAWDTRPQLDGGQRWYHLYPDSDVAPGDPLHWTRPAQRWNYQCAACHSTAVQKNYDVASDRYNTTWSDLNVGCEACHGPGSAHVEWVASGAATATGAQAGFEAAVMGLAVDLADRDEGRWSWPAGESIATRTPERTSDLGLRSCVACHARRRLIDDDPAAGAPPLDVISPALLTEELYYADGQIRDEVFVLGSFLQSAMYREGVTCADCHDPHSLQLRRPGNSLCAGCHLPASYDTSAHHYHVDTTVGAECVSCHMPTRTYMGIDARRDHSIRVPRPDLTVTLGTPNACTQCHTEQSAAWAAEATARWYGSERAAHYGEVLARGRTEVMGDGVDLSALALDDDQSGIVRATAFQLLGGHPGPVASRAIAAGLTDGDPIVRYGAVQAIEAVPAPERPELLFPLLRDSVKLVRTEAARALALTFSGAQAVSPLLDSIVDEYVTARLIDADRPEAHMSTATIFAARGRLGDAERALQIAIRVDSTAAAAYVNYADLLRAQGRDTDGERLLRLAIESAQDDDAVRHSLGLLLVRQNRLEEAIAELRAAAEARPDDARYVYVYGVALHSAGEVELAIRVLVEAYTRHPADIDIFMALLTYHRDSGELDEAIALAQQWLELRPDDGAVRQELANLERLRDAPGPT